MSMTALPVLVQIAEPVLGNSPYERRGGFVFGPENLFLCRAVEETPEYLRLIIPETVIRTHDDAAHGEIYRLEVTYCV
ncbi:hypothetical protein [uncultured Desulfovibrio sp.]|uniref:hypothetical protein n=2 Tax=uncultured Desulfovibrio sp. TaxID=167968 RepID=UPI0025D9AD1D|nr:hypothetical protein [uncultured Desulfovibrio sp.]